MGLAFALLAGAADGARAFSPEGSVQNEIEAMRAAVLPAMRAAKAAAKPKAKIKDLSPKKDAKGGRAIFLNPQPLPP